MEILELEYTISEINALDRLNGRRQTTKRQRVSEFEATSLEIIQSGKKKIEKINEQSFRTLSKCLTCM